LKFSFYERDSLGIAGITATPDFYDGVPPISTLRFDYDLRKMHRDRFAVASVLFFSEYCAGPIRLPESVSPELASAIEVYLGGNRARVMDVEYDPYAAPTGTNVLDVSRELRSDNPENVPGEIRSVFLDVLNGDLWFGSIGNIDHIISATNGHIVGSGSSLRDYEIAIGTVVAFADLLFGGAVRVSSPVEIGSVEQHRVARLLAACNLQLVSS